MQTIVVRLMEETPCLQLVRGVLFEVEKSIPADTEISVSTTEQLSHNGKLCTAVEIQGGEFGGYFILARGLEAELPLETYRVEDLVGALN